MQFLEIEWNDQKIKIAHKIHGAGPRVVLLHGWMHSHEIWAKVINLLADQYELVSIDLPGFGSSPALESDKISIESYVEIIEHLISRLGREKRISTVVADSLSGIFIVHSLQKSPILPFGSLLISGAPLKGLPFQLLNTPISLLISPALRVLKSSEFARATLLKIFLSYVVRFRSELGTEIENAVADADPHTAQRLFKAMKRETPISYADALQKYNCTFLRGRFDRVMSQSTLEEWAAATNGTYVEIEKAAHTPMIEAPSIYAAAIQKLTKEAMEQYRHEEKL